MPLSRATDDARPATEAQASLVAEIAGFSARFRLSEREMQVLQGAAEGRSMKESAAELGLSAKTVEDYWSRIYTKTRRRSQLGVVARLLEWVTAAAQRSGHPPTSTG
jgi:DNA-binding NarL/FixJ family response regulator